MIVAWRQFIGSIADASPVYAMPLAEVAGNFFGYTVKQEASFSD